jgi:hypothetical protein
MSSAEDRKELKGKSPITGAVLWEAEVCVSRRDLQQCCSVRIGSRHSRNLTYYYFLLEWSIWTRKLSHSETVIGKSWAFGVPLSECSHQQHIATDCLTRKKFLFISLFKQTETLDTFASSLTGIWRGVERNKKIARNEQPSVKRDGTCNNGMNLLNVVWSHIYLELREGSIFRNPKILHAKTKFLYYLLGE